MLHRSLHPMVLVLCLAACGGSTLFSRSGTSVTLVNGTVTVVEHGDDQIVVGSGIDATAARDVPSFGAIEVRGILKADVTVGEPASLQIHGDDNLLPMVISEVTGDTLVLRTEGSFRTSLGLRVTVTVPSLDDIATSGTASLMVRGVDEGTLRVRCEGGSTLGVAGTIETLEARISGTSEASIYGMSGGGVDADVSGAASLTVSGSIRGAHVSVSGTAQAVLEGCEGGLLDAEVSGAAALDVSGRVDDVTVSATGTSEVSVHAIQGGRLRVRLDGASGIAASGTAASVEVAASGTSGADLSHLEARAVNVSLSGASRVSAHVTESLTGDASGASSVSYTGAPRRVDIGTSGAAAVRAR